MGCQELGDCLVDEVVAGGVEVEQGLANGLLQLVGVEAVDVAAPLGAVPVAAPAHVVAVSVVASVGDGTDVFAAALRAGDFAGEGVFGGVRCSLSDFLAAFGEDVLGVLELGGGDDWLVRVGDGDVAEALLADVLAVGDDRLDGAL
nr:hypothetical protein [Micromonospora aurantiaca]